MPSCIIVAGSFRRHIPLLVLLSCVLLTSFIEFLCFLFSFVLNSNDNPRSITSKINIFFPVSDSFFTRTDECSLKTRREASSENAICP